MNSPLVSKITILLVSLASTAEGYDPGADDIAAVSGRASSDYVRSRQKDGSYVPETYTFGKGGNWSGAMKDASIDQMTFLDVAHVIAHPLAGQNYFPSTKPAETMLLIMVYWGTTHAPQHPSETNGMMLLQDATSGSAARASIDSAIALVQAENIQRQQEDVLNIRMLGYDSWFDRTRGDRRGTAFEIDRKDLYDEVEQNRYFVVLMAYDFGILSRAKKHKLLWETRFSIRQSHHQFDKELPALAQYASRYFGQDSGGLVHERVPQGQVDIGEVRSLGEAPPK